MEAIQTRNMKKRAISVFFFFPLTKLIAIEYPPTIFKGNISNRSSKRSIFHCYVSLRECIHILLLLLLLLIIIITIMIIIILNNNNTTHDNKNNISKII